MYLQSAVEEYKLSNKLPVWVMKSRTFLDNLDDNMKTEEIEKINEISSENPKDSNPGWMSLFDNNGFASMDFLQIKADENNSYEVRDDYELKHVMKRQRKEEEEEEEEEEERNTDESTRNPSEPKIQADFVNDPSKIVDELFEISVDQNEMNQESAANDCNGYEKDSAKNFLKLDGALDEFDNMAERVNSKE